MRRKYNLVELVICILAFASSPPQGKAQEIIAIEEINSVSSSVTETLPFDRPILLKYLTRERIQIEYIGLVQIKKKDTQLYYNELLSSPGQFVPHNSGDYPNEQLTISQTVNPTGANKFQLNIFIPPLAPNRFYDISLLRRPTYAEAEMYVELFQIYHDAGAVNEIFNDKLRQINDLKKPFQHLVDEGPGEGQLDWEPLVAFYTSRLKEYYAKLALTSKDEKDVNAIKSVIKEIIRNYKPTERGAPDILIFGQSLRLSTTSLNFDTRTSFSITPDFGYVYYGYQSDFQGLAPYIGAQIEFRYFDKNIPFRLILNKTWLHYLSFTTGLTLTSVGKEGKRDDFFSGKSLLTGLGFRLSNAIRITGGGIMFYKEDPNPAIDDKKLRITPFLGISVDLRLKSIMGDLTDLVPSNRK